MSKKIEDQDLEDDEIVLDDPEEELEDEEEIDRGDLINDEEDEEEEDEDEPEPAKPVKIPKARLDEVIRQREEAKTRNKWLEDQITALINKQTEQVKEQAPKVPDYDYATSEEAYANLLIEGDFAKASKLRLEIDAAKKAELMAMIGGIKEGMIDKAKAESSAAIEQDRFSTLVEALEIKYPFLNVNHDDYNEEATDTVNTLMIGYQAAGKSKTEALKMAVNKVTTMFKGEVEKKEKPSLGKERTKAAGLKAAKAAKSQPIKTKSSSSINRDTDKVDVSKMTDREFEKLTDKEKKALRGDF